jgi:hypothetical protein
LNDCSPSFSSVISSRNGRSAAPSASDCTPSSSLWRLVTLGVLEPPKTLAKSPDRADLGVWRPPSSSRASPSTDAATDAASGAAATVAAADSLLRAAVTILLMLGFHMLSECFKL